MSVLCPVIIVSAVLLGVALAGPLLIRRASPALVRLPNAASVLLPGGVLLWLAGIFSVGPLLAWMSSGPVILPNGAAEVCQRCIAAANPFGADPLTTMIPTILLFLIPTIAAIALIFGMVYQAWRRRAETRKTAAQLLEGGKRMRIAGYGITVIPDEGVLASSLPASHGSIVLSRGALDVLSDDELVAVLAHEHAHVTRRHHLIKSVMDSLVALLGWVPLIAECGRALPGYLEIAADKHAQRTAGTPAVVSALVTLGQRQQHTAGVLHMAGPERVRQLVAPVMGAAGALPTAAMVLHMLALVSFTALVMAPYGKAIIAGCL